MSFSYRQALREVYDDHHEVFDEERKADEEGYYTHSNRKVACVREAVSAHSLPILHINKLVRNAAKYNDGKELKGITHRHVSNPN